MKLLRSLVLAGAGLAALVGCDHTNQEAKQQNTLRYIEPSGNLLNNFLKDGILDYRLTRTGMDFLRNFDAIPEAVAVGYDTRFLDTTDPTSPKSISALTALYARNLLPEQANGYASFLRFSLNWKMEGDAAIRKSEAIDDIAFLHRSGVTPDQMVQFFNMNTDVIKIDLEDVVNYVRLGIPLEEIQQRARTLEIDETLRK